MIAKLRGIVDGIGDDHVVLDVGGVGYLVFCSSRTLRSLPERGGDASLLVDTHVREDHIHLYGFGDGSEREWFRILQGVQGVGARVALAILSILAPDELIAVLAAGDKAALGRANGVGPRLATRIASELKDKAGALALGRVGAAGAEAPLSADWQTGGAVQDALSALGNLGYRPTDAHGAVAAAARALGSNATVEALITRSLKELAR
ncbi:Holliday junction branch migration protein RuvA [Oceanibacterium hippocampi]|uniref:Holliday junction branch migration complex subunit RuvA n=1 Tax=Oceanibacterium hippocampi TaxID=745714 RepID=A0A1Y5TVT1_9PROT|nr:Holliday junction branch migration protein RuvA [Oceanibacterium hippocampi]SLN73379.1 Holliday junction ATP-dependent DNA helicase RuvA [Oceanibacterium hippocampi]